MKKILKRKLEGDALKNLVEALEENSYYEYFHRENGWTCIDLTGKVSAKLIEEGFDIELRLKAKDMHVHFGPEGIIGREYGTRNYILKGVIPYSPKINKLETKI
ncbi:MAG TPA: hypothetical protein VMV95_02735 [Bacillota bacterium]|nr:hypothetical protein [Bacillota bacterium]